jgi:hypothetical protein
MRNALLNKVSYRPSIYCFASPAVCLDGNQNLISCLDPECTYGDCGSAGVAQISGDACLDSNQNPISCSDPECTYGDCTPSPTAKIGLAAVSGENGPTSLSIPAAGGATSAGNTASLVNSFSNAITAASKVFTAPPKTSVSLGASGLSISSAGSLFSNPLMLALLAVIAFLIFAVWKKR